MPLAEVLQQLREQCEYTFSYNPDAIPLQEKLSLQFQGKSIKYGLDRLGEACGIGYHIRGQRIILFPDAKNKQVTISGFVQDAESGEKLISARVVDVRTGRGVLTNEYGFFSLKLPADSVSLLVSYATYKNLRLRFLLRKSKRLNCELQPDYELGVVEIIADEMEPMQIDYDPATLNISIQEIKNMPALLGEADAIKSIQLMPGVQAGREGSSGLYVRGGGPDQNLVLLDGVPLYYVSHLGGFFSIFNPDALHDVRLIKGGFPARYGGRLSSVLDVHMKEGNMKEWHGAGSIGLLTGKFSIEGPLKKDKSSFIISARRSYLDLFLSPIIKQITSDAVSLSYVFYDLNAKINYVLGDRDRFFFSMYSGHDRTRTSYGYEFNNDRPGRRESNTFRSSYDIKWGNNIFAARWNHIWSPKLFSNVSATYGYYSYSLDHKHRYRFEEAISRETRRFDFNWRFNSGIEDIGLRWDFDFFPHPRHKIKFGVGILHHLFQPGFIQQTTVTDADRIERFQFRSDSSGVRSVEAQLYVEENWRISERWRLQLGAHGVFYRVGKTNYPSLQPRAALFGQLTKHLTFKASFASMTQYVHLLTNPGVDLPSDRWVPATEEIPPQQSEQIAAGFWWAQAEKGLSISLEGYYKRLSQLITYEKAEDFFNQVIRWEDYVERNGKGTTYGAEVFLRKQKGKTTGWISYTLSWNFREFEHINDGKPFPFRYDRRHDINITLQHQFSEKVKLSANWVYGTGHAFTRASGWHNSWLQDLGDISVFEITSVAGLLPPERNGSRMRAYHRLDLGIQLIKEKAWGERIWQFSIFNAYNRRNPYFYYYESSIGATPGGQTRPWFQLMQYSLFAFIPSINYHFSF